MTNQGGTLRVEHDKGSGTTFVAEVPDIRGTLNVISFEGAGSSIRFAVPATYGLRRATTSTPAVVLEELLDIPMGASKAAEEGPVEIFWGKKKVVIASGGSLTPHRAWRRCPTAESELIEVVWIDGIETLLVRPEVLHEQLAAR
jgi:hypothetical protein